jgi:hypothetical protein
MIANDMNNYKCATSKQNKQSDFGTIFIKNI